MRAPHGSIAVLLAGLLAAGCGGTSSKLAETPPYDVSEGDYLTEREYEDLSKDDATAYCQEMEREIDIQNDNAKLSEASLATTETEVAALRTQIDEAQRTLSGTQVAASDATSTTSDLPTSYTVVPGDWLSKIALKPEIYGDWREWPRIHRANDAQIRNPDLIYPGQVFTIPRDGGGGNGGEVDEGLSLIGGPTSEEAPPASEGERIHVVQPGETLRILAEREYGSREEWDRIWEANRTEVGNPDLLLAGTSLVIP